MGLPKSKGDVKIIQAIDRHIEEHIGQTAFVLDEKDSPYVHVDIYVVATTQERQSTSLLLLA
jgi:hypothetical protein